MYRIICDKSGDSADAPDAASVLVAADTLAHDYMDAMGAQGALQVARTSMLVVRILDRNDPFNVQYEGRLTEMARRGWRS